MGGFWKDHPIHVCFSGFIFQPCVFVFWVQFLLRPYRRKRESIGALNRKRIADIGVKYNGLTPQKKTLLINYAKEKAGVDIENDAFKVQSETDLKKVLYAMDQRYYYAEIYEENRVASLVRVITTN